MTTTMERGMSDMCGSIGRSVLEASEAIDLLVPDHIVTYGGCPEDRSEEKAVSITTEDRLTSLYNRLRDQAIAKNRAYGDSALHPIGLFGSGRAKDAIGARIDDKLSRFKNHHGAFGENDVEDLIGYLGLWLLADEDGKGEA